jgi:choline kinase
VIGLVLAAGAGRRLRPYTDDLPKALVPLDERRTVLDVTLASFAAAGLTDVAIVAGYRGDAIRARVSGWEAATGLRISVVWNDHAEDRNNAYSLWCARDVLLDGALLANGDTLHPLSVDRALLETADPASDALLLAVDDVKVLGDEEMKVLCDGTGRVKSISKLLPHDADGEYIGVSLVPSAGAPALIDALERTWRHDAQQYYEDAYQLLADEGHAIEARSIGDVEWTEIDDHVDLARARELVCRY